MYTVPSSASQLPWQWLGDGFVGGDLNMCRASRPISRSSPRLQASLCLGRQLFISRLVNYYSVLLPNQVLVADTPQGFTVTLV